MQAHLTDRKLSVLFDRYKDADFAANAGKEVEEIRNRALKRGVIATGAAFVLNEVVRLSSRSRKFESFQIILRFILYLLYYFYIGCLFFI